MSLREFLLRFKELLYLIKTAYENCTRGDKINHLVRKDFQQEPVASDPWGETTRTCLTVHTMSACLHWTEEQYEYPFVTISDHDDLIIISLHLIVNAAINMFTTLAIISLNHCYEY